ncbi:MAG: hypothetical protein ACPGO5_02015 [Patescibacteria group bacterium]
MGDGRKRTSKLQKSFAIVIVACIAIIFFSSFDDIQAKARDATRQSDVQDIVKAMDLYYDRFGKYPDTIDSDYGGWDTTIEPEGHPQQFMAELVKEGLLSGHPADPVNDNVYYYRYQSFPRGSFGCTRAFVVFQIFNFETIQEGHGSGDCPERDFISEAPNGFTIFRFQ